MMYVQKMLTKNNRKTKFDKETILLSAGPASFWLTASVANHSVEFCWVTSSIDQSQRTALWGVLPLCCLCVDIGALRGNFNISFIIWPLLLLKSTLQWRSYFTEPFLYGFIMIAPAACCVCVGASQGSLLAALANVAWAINWFAGELHPRL